jgi:hypothetical protein
MTHDPRARSALTDAINEHFNAVDYDGTHPIVEDILTALTAAGLRVVPVEPSEADVERATLAVINLVRSHYASPPLKYVPNDQRAQEIEREVRAALRAFLQRAPDAPP